MERCLAMQATFLRSTGKDFAKIQSRHQNAQNAPIVWIVTGDSDELIEDQVAGEMHNMITGSALVVLPEVGHFAPLQDPETFNALLDIWLSSR